MVDADQISVTDLYKMVSFPWYYTSHFCEWSPSVRKAYSDISMDSKVFDDSENLNNAHEEICSVYRPQEICM